MLEVKSSFNKQYLEFDTKAVARNINPRRVWSFYAITEISPFVTLHFRPHTVSWKFDHNCKWRL